MGSKNSFGTPEPAWHLSIKLIQRRKNSVVQIFFLSLMDVCEIATDPQLWPVSIRTRTSKKLGDHVGVCSSLPSLRLLAC